MIRICLRIATSCNQGYTVTRSGVISFSDVIGTLQLCSTVRFSIFPTVKVLFHPSLLWSSYRGSHQSPAPTMNSSDRKRPRSDDSGSEIREKISSSDLKCPICFDIFKGAYVTSCGHSFCHQCIERSLQRKSECPVCKQILPLNVKQFSPNFTLNDIVARVKATEQNHSANVRAGVKQIMSLVSKLDNEEAKEFRKALDEEIEKMDQEDSSVTSTTYDQFVEECIRRKEMEYEKIGKQLEYLKKESVKLETSGSSSSSSSSRQELSEDGKAMLAHRLQQLYANFDDIERGFFNEIQPPECQSEVVEEPNSAVFKKQLANITKYSNFRDVATLYYGDLPVTSGSSIVSSIEFDKDGDFFAVGGVTRKIKIYEYRSVAVQNPQFNSLHYPILEIPCQAKLSSVCYNPYLKNQLAASDYDGTLSIWDTHHQRCLHNFQEHEKRVWSVSYNTYEPAMIVTGGDDCALKLWHLSKSHSIFSKSNAANVCSVRFQPGHRYNLAFGSADHMIRLVDIRKFTEPYLVLKGHRKAVSYVQYLSDTELVSASTDSELKLWSTQTGQCLKTYRGHVNEKNFVGLTVNDEFIACGSENNSFCVYHKYVTQPILKYKFDIPHSVLPGSQEQRDEGNDFVSSVCFRKDSRTVIAANSLGYIKMLEMS